MGGEVDAAARIMSGAHHRARVGRPGGGRVARGDGAQPASRAWAALPAGTRSGSSNGSRPTLRLDALREAKADGTFGQREHVVLAAAPGMGGRAADERRAPTTGSPRSPPTPTPRSSTWSPPGTRRSRARATARARGWRWRSPRTEGPPGATGVPLCACKGSAQFDPIIEVVPNTGHVYAALHERLQRGVHQVDEPRPDVVHARSRRTARSRGPTSRSSR